MALGTTVDALIQRVRRDSLLAGRNAVYTVSATTPYTANDATITLNETPSHIGVGAILSVDYELFYVMGVNSGTQTVSVLGGHMNTTPANHAANAIIDVDPRMPPAMLLDFAEHEIQSWGKELWRVVSFDLPVIRTERTYDLPIAAGQQVYFLLDCRARPTDNSSVTQWWNFSWVGDGWPHIDARLIRGMDVSEFASGYAIQFAREAGRSSTYRVAIAQPFDLDPFDSTTDLITTVGLQRNWFDILEFGLRQRALQSLVVGRIAFRHGHMSREAEEVTAIDVVRAASQAADMRDLRFTKAAVDLRGDFPFKESSL